MTPRRLRFPWWVAPWHSYRVMRALRRKARADFAASVARARVLWHDNEQLRREIEYVRVERDDARRQLDAIRDQRSRTVSRGNRTRSLRRHGALAPEPITAGLQADQRNELTG